MVERQAEAADVISADPDIDAFVFERRAGRRHGLRQPGPLHHPAEASQPCGTPRPSRSSRDCGPSSTPSPALRTYLQNPPLVRIGGFVSRSLYQYTLQAPNIAELYRAADAFEQRMRTVPGLTDVNSDLQISSPQVTVDIDRDRASALGVTAGQVENALYDAYGAREIVHHLHAPPTPTT